jgi:hypothetical protein
MELRLHHIVHLYNVFLENDGKENCAQLIEEEFNKMFGIKSLNGEHDYNVFCMNSLNIHDANDMQSHKLGDSMFDEDDIFSPPSFDENIYYDESMPPIYDDYGDDMYAINSNDIQETFHHDFNAQYDYANQESHDSYFVEFAPTTIRENKFAYVGSNKKFMHVDHEKNALCDSYIVEFIHDATENYYERGIYASTYFNNIKFPLFILKVLKLHLFCLPMLVDSCSHNLFAHKIPMHRKWVRLKCASHMLHDALFVFQFFTFM